MTQAVIFSPKLSRSGAIVAEKTFTPLNGFSSPSLRMLFPVLADICKSTSCFLATGWSTDLALTAARRPPVPHAPGTP